MTALTQSAPTPAAGDNPGRPIIHHYVNLELSGHVTATAPGSTQHTGRVRVRSAYGLHNRGCRVTVSTDPGLAMITFRAGEADIMLVLSGSELDAFTSALIAATPCTCPGCKR